MDHKSKSTKKKKINFTYSKKPCYKLYTTKKNLFIKTDFQSKYMLVICRKTGKISFKLKQKIEKILDKMQEKEFTVLPIFCVFGMVRILNRQILLLVTEVALAGSFRKRPILKIEEVKGKIVVKDKHSTRNGEEMLVIMEHIRKYLKKAFYFSHFYDLTTKFPWSLFEHGRHPEHHLPKNPWTLNDFDPSPGPSLHSQTDFDLMTASKDQIETLYNENEKDLAIPSINKMSSANSIGLGRSPRGGSERKEADAGARKSPTKRISVLNTKFDQRIESIFAWNLNSISAFHEAPTWKQSMNVFFPPIIQGHVGMIRIKDRLDLLVVSRRSYIMGGTRYNSRGINSSGFVGNYAETEQIMDLGHKVYSYVQIRGSVPFYWDQKSVGREVRINQTNKINRDIMLKHFEILRDRFNFRRVVILNLLSKWKKQEVKLGRHLHKLYLDNFSNKRIRRKDEIRKMTSITSSMDVQWLESMNQGKAKEPLAIDSILEENKPERERVSKNSTSQQRMIEAYDQEATEETQYSVITRAGMNIYVQHIDFHSIGRAD